MAPSWPQLGPLSARTAVNSAIPQTSQVARKAYGTNRSNCSGVGSRSLGIVAPASSGPWHVVAGDSSSKFLPLDVVPPLQTGGFARRQELFQVRASSSISRTIVAGQASWQRKSPWAVCRATAAQETIERREEGRGQPLYRPGPDHVRAARPPFGTESSTPFDFAGLFVILAAAHFFLDTASLHQLSEATHRLLNGLAFPQRQFDHKCSLVVLDTTNPVGIPKILGEPFNLYYRQVTCPPVFQGSDSILGAGRLPGGRGPRRSPLFPPGEGGRRGLEKLRSEMAGGCQIPRRAHLGEG